MMFVSHNCSLSRKLVVARRYRNAQVRCAKGSAALQQVGNSARAIRCQSSNAISGQLGVAEQKHAYVVEPVAR